MSEVPLYLEREGLGSILEAVEQLLDPLWLLGREFCIDNLLA